jgi:hypothetical protein
MRILLLVQAARCRLLNSFRVRTDVVFKKRDLDSGYALEDAFEAKNKDEVGPLVLRHQLMEADLVFSID